MESLHLLPGRVSVVDYLDRLQAIHRSILERHWNVHDDPGKKGF